MYVDPSGNFFISIIMIGLITGAIIGATAGGIVAHNIAENNGVEGWKLFGWTIAGIVGGGIIGGAVGAGIGAIITNTTGIYGLSITKYYILPIKQVTVLGHYGYSATASSVGAGSYQISTKLYNSLSPTLRSTNNMQYIKDAIQAGSQFEIIPTRVVDSTCMLYYEMRYLVERGIQWLSGF